LLLLLLLPVLVSLLCCASAEAAGRNDKQLVLSLLGQGLLNHVSLKACMLKSC
jgi:hypothetical protein